MAWIGRLWETLNSLAPAELAVALSVTSAILFLVEERRIALLPLLGQYLVLGLIIGGRVFRPVLALFVGIGVAVCLVLLISAGRAQRIVSAASGTGENPETSETVRPESRYMGSRPIYSAMSLILAGVAAYGVWRAYPIEGIPPALSLASYWLVANGIVLATIGRDPLRVGLGIITLVNGTVSAYLLLERSLFVFSLLGALYGLIALATVICTESWIEAYEGDASS